MSEIQLKDNLVVKINENIKGDQVTVTLNTINEDFYMYKYTFISEKYGEVMEITLGRIRVLDYNRQTDLVLNDFLKRYGDIKLRNKLKEFLI